MNRIFLLLATGFIFSNSAQASIVPVEKKDKKVYLLKTESLKISINSEIQKDLTARFNTTNESLEFESAHKISYIQIFKDSEMLYQLPVMSETVKIGKSIFDNGEYQVGFLLQGKKEVVLTNISIK